MIHVLGIPYDADSSYLKGCQQGPQAIRDAFESPSSNKSSESGIELGDHEAIRFEPDMTFSEDANPRDAIENRVRQLLEIDRRILSLGGDHSITYPILKAYASKHGPINLIQLDAHSDLYDEFEGNRFSHACPFARAHEDGLIRRHLQVGIRTLNEHQRAQARKFAVEIVPMQNWPSQLSVEFQGPTYLTLDLDVLDPASAPGISHYEPGGANVRQVIQLLHDMDAPLVGADIVELNPTRDFQGMTAMVAAKLMKEILARMVQRPN